MGKKKKDLLDKLSESKKLSGQEFYKNRFKLIEIVIISLLVAAILSFIEYIFYFLPDTAETRLNKVMVIVIAFGIAVWFYRYHLYKQRKKT